MNTRFGIISNSDGTVNKRVVINDIDKDTYVINHSIIYKIIRAYMSNEKRVRSSHYKSQRGESGSNKKIRRQKGLGRSRQGSSKQIHMRGGSVKFGFSGDKYRDAGRRCRAYKHINIKEGRKCLLDIIMNRFINNNMFIVDNLHGCMKCKDALFLLKRILGEGNVIKDAVVVYSCPKEQVAGFGNLKDIDLFNVSSFNAYKCIKRKKLVIDEAAFCKLVKNMSYVFTIDYSKSS